MSIDEKLTELGITLPRLREPAGNYVHGVLTENLLFLAGKGPNDSFGKVGADISSDEAYQVAREVGLYRNGQCRSNVQRPSGRDQRLL